MPISAIHDVKGGPFAQYDQIIEALGEHAQSPGGLAHIATATPDGFLVCDIWESQEDFENFLPQLLPRAEAAGLAPQTAPKLGRVEKLIVSDDANTLPAVAVLYSFAGMTVAQYYDLLASVNADGPPPITRRAHIASETADGIFVLGVWESEPAFHDFEPLIQRAFAACGVAGAAPVIGQIHRLAFIPGAGLHQPAHA